jgi:predicted RNA-binding protein (virulence factor B family)
MMLLGGNIYLNTVNKGIYICEDTQEDEVWLRNLETDELELFVGDELSNFVEY